MISEQLRVNHQLPSPAICSVQSINLNQFNEEGCCKLVAAAAQQHSAQQSCASLSLPCAWQLFRNCACDKQGWEGFLPAPPAQYLPNSSSTLLSFWHGHCCVFNSCLVTPAQPFLQQGTGWDGGVWVILGLRNVCVRGDIISDSGPQSLCPLLGAWERQFQHVIDGLSGKVTHAGLTYFHFMLCLGFFFPICPTSPSSSALLYLLCSQFCPCLSFLEASLCFSSLFLPLHVFPPVVCTSSFYL